MKKEIKTVVFDETLRIEAYHFKGMSKPFPNHFHEYYVIGLVERGQRVLSCKNREYRIDRGSIVLFHPGDNHACAQNDSGLFDYRGMNISKEIMSELTEEITGRGELPGFSCNVIYDEEIACGFKALHEMVMNDTETFEKEEALLFFISALMKRYGKPFPECVPECGKEIERACEFMEQHYTEHISLEEICRYVALSKSTLIRAFTKAKGITPYRYLENIRIGKAKKLLGQGIPPLEAAIQTGFSDQSHFTNYFSSFIGIAPGVYREIFGGKDKEDESSEK